MSVSVAAGGAPPLPMTPGVDGGASLPTDSVWAARIHAAETPEALLGVLRELGAAIAAAVGGPPVDITADGFRAVCAERRGAHPESWTRDVALAFGRAFSALKEQGSGAAGSGAAAAAPAPAASGSGGGGGGAKATAAAPLPSVSDLPPPPPPPPAGAPGAAGPEGGARTASDYRAPLLRLNPRVVPLGGLRVRRHPQGDAEQVCLRASAGGGGPSPLTRGCGCGGAQVGILLHGVDIMVGGSRGDWVKLAGAMQAMISGAPGGRPYDAAAEGWVLRRLDSTDSLIPTLPPAVSEEPVWFRMTSMAPTLRVRRSPDVSSDCVGVIGRDRMWLLVRTSGAWGQLAATMYDAVQRTPRARPYAAAAGGEGWVMLGGEGYTFMVPAAPGSFYVASEGGLRVRRSPDVGSEHVATLAHHQVVLVDRIGRGWAKLVLSTVPGAPALDAEAEGWVLVAEGAVCLLCAT